MNNNKNSANKEYDDFYGSDDNDENIDYLSNKDLDRSIQRITPIGYSDGLEIGKEKTLQRGFNEGFKQSSEISYKWSLLLGLVSSVDVFLHHNKQFIPSGKDTAVLGDLVEKINQMIKDHCCSPSIEQLKEEFINFKDLSIEPTTSTSTTTSSSSSTTSCNKGENKQDECCGGNSNCSEKDIAPTPTTTPTPTNTTSDSGESSDEEGCCGGKGKDEGNCCKSTKTKTTTTTHTSDDNKVEEFQFIIEKMGGKSFDELKKECVETISSFGLNGQEMLDECLAKKFRVTIN